VLLCCLCVFVCGWIYVGGVAVSFVVDRWCLMEDTVGRAGQQDKAKGDETNRPTCRRIWRRVEEWLLLTYCEWSWILL
jgi:hypothetical protein